VSTGWPGHWLGIWCAGYGVDMGCAGNGPGMVWAGNSLGKHGLCLVSCGLGMGRALYVLGMGGARHALG
jgi:hypothetical protein